MFPWHKNHFAPVIIPILLCVSTVECFWIHFLGSPSGISIKNSHCPVFCNINNYFQWDMLSSFELLLLFRTQYFQLSTQLHFIMLYSSPAFGCTSVARKFDFLLLKIKQPPTHTGVEHVVFSSVQFLLGNITSQIYTGEQTILVINIYIYSCIWWKDSALWGSSQRIQAKTRFLLKELISDA